jgi:sterol desaturase/sphingolipid hydroxylase (fatty acid hydroxylase superfamily)
MLWRFPEGAPALPAIRPALAITAAWLFIWPYQLPWYDAMVICLLVVYPASRLDWLVLARVTAGTFALMPGNAGFPPQYVLKTITSDSLFYWAPVVLLLAALALAWLCWTGRWEMGPAFRPREAELPLLV